jgi:NAD(P)H-flavin reductase
MHSTENLQV